MKEFILNINTYELQILTTALMILWFETFGVGTIIKVKWLKIPFREYTRPWDCRYCTHFWLGNIVALIFGTIALIYQSLPLGVACIKLVFINIIISQIYEITISSRKIASEHSGEG